MSQFHNVALLGKGFVGSAVLKQLVSSGFAVTVLTRNQSSAKDIPDGVSVSEVDYSSLDSLTNALKGIDVAISTVSAMAIGGQKVAIDACIQAGVKRYIPCNWSALFTDPKTKGWAAYAPMRDIQDYLDQKAASGELEYTSICNGAFFDMIFTTPIFINFNNHSVRLYDNGVHPVSTTRLDSVGKAVVGVLKNGEGTKNRILRIHETTVTQAQLLALAKKHSPPEVKWTETVVDAKAELQKAGDSIRENGVNEHNLIAQLVAGLLCGEFEAAYKSVDNELVGLGYLSDEEVEARVIAKLKN